MVPILKHQAKGGVTEAILDFWKPFLDVLPSDCPISTNKCQKLIYYTKEPRKSGITCPCSNYISIVIFAAFEKAAILDFWQPFFLLPSYCPISTNKCQKWIYYTKEHRKSGITCPCSNYISKFIFAACVMVAILDFQLSRKEHKENIWRKL